MADPFNIVVAGDLILDHHVYAGDRAKLADHGRRDTHIHDEPGGAALLHRLIAAVMDKAADTEVRIGLVGPPALPHSYAVWDTFPLGAKPDQRKVWRAIRPLGFGGESAQLLAPLGQIPAVDLLVLDDGGLSFRHDTNRALWHLPEQGDELPRWILLKHTAPVAQGALWRALQKHLDRLVCLVAAQDLRQEAIGLSRGLSWESTLHALQRALRHHPAVNPLCQCRHLIVSFSADGALWLDNTNPNGPIATLCFDAGGAEGGWFTGVQGTAFGYHTAFAAALVQRLAAHAAGPDSGKPLDLAPALECGLRAMRDLLELGHGEVDSTVRPEGYPVARLATLIHDEKGGFARAKIDWDNEPSKRWMLLESTQHPPDVDGPASTLGLAMQIAQRGPVVLERLPHAEFGALVSAERGEIETMRHLRALMRAYKSEERSTRPLNIGVFGPPGAGKSFGVKELAKNVFGEGGWLEFNLSQFNDPEELHGAFHRVRDLVLGGLIPVAFWDEFDSRELHWLQYLLAPMQDGKFQAGQLTHTMGKCVFVFAGGTRSSFQAFAQRSDSDKLAFVARKGPDFISRLDAHFNVLGPNPRQVDGSNEVDITDRGVPLRRALLLRGLLRLGKSDKLHVDAGLLRAILTVPHYTHGSRSLEKLLVPLHRNGRGALRRSALPAEPQLAMHVDPKAFLPLLVPREGDLASLEAADIVEEMAKAIHATWRKIPVPSNGPRKTAEFDREFAELSDAGREDNRAAARRIPRVLALAGLALCAKEKSLSKETVAAQLAHNMERLAEAEHQGWVDHRAANGWQYAEERSDEMLQHPAMRRYADLPEVEKEKDRSSIRNYHEFAGLAGLGIGWLE